MTQQHWIISLNYSQTYYVYKDILHSLPATTPSHEPDYDHLRDAVNLAGDNLLATLCRMMSAAVFQLVNGVYGPDYYTRFDTNHPDSTLDYFWW